MVTEKNFSHPNFFLHFQGKGEHLKGVTFSEDLVSYNSSLHRYFIPFFSPFFLEEHN